MGRFDCKYNLQLVSSFKGWLLAVIQLYEYILFYFHLCDGRRGFWFMAIDTTFNNVSVISCRSVLLVDEIGVPGESQWSVASHWHILSQNIASSTPCHERIRTCNFNGDNHLLHMWLQIQRTGQRRSLRWQTLHLRQKDTIITSLSPFDSCQLFNISRYNWHIAESGVKHHKPNQYVYPL